MRRAILLIALLFPAFLPMARCDATLLNENVTLDTAGPTKSYFYDLAIGNTVSIKITVTGDPISFFIFSSTTTSTLLSKYDISNLNEQWTAPYDAQFEFHIETSGTHAAVSITLTSTGSDQPTQGNTLFDEQFTITASEAGNDHKDFHANLTNGERIHVSISVVGNPVSLFGIYNKTETTAGRLLEKRDLTSFNEDWTAPYTDKFDFYLVMYSGSAQIHFTMQKPSEGTDPTSIVVVVLVVLIVLISVFLIFRMRKQPPLPPPPPPPPPP
jgi:hypothetical protein